MKLFRTGIIATFVLAAALSAAPPASAKGGDDVRRSGKCTAGSTWTMKAKPDDGRIEVDLEVDSNRVGQVWSVVLADNGHRIFAGSRRTVAPSGSFELELRNPNRAGADRFTASVRTANGEICSAGVTI